MRDFKGMKRQRGRNRGGNTGGGGGGKPQHNVNRAFDSNGPDGVKIRGNAQHVFEKYQQLARDAASAGDRILAENYLQHAEHYFRVLRAVQPQRPPSDFLGRDTFTSGFDIDFEDEGNNNFVEGDASAEGDAQPSMDDGGEARAEQPYRNDQNREPRDQQRDWGRERQERRDQQRREERPRDERPREDRPRDDRPRDERPRDRFQRGEGRFNDRPAREDRSREEREPRDSQPRDPLAVVEPEPGPLGGEGGHHLRSQDGGLSPAPAFLQARADRPPESVAEDSEPRRPRRRRAPRSFENDAGEAAPETEEV
jgi:hypothetical protein